MPTQSIELSPNQAEFIRQRVESGEYDDASELISTAIELLAAQERGEEAQLERLRAELDKGFEAIEAGRYITLDSKEKREAYFKDVVRRGKERLAKESDASARPTH